MGILESNLVANIFARKDLIIMELEQLLESNLLTEEDKKEKLKNIEDLKSEIDYMEMLLETLNDDE